VAIRIRLATPADGAACAAVYRPYVEGAVVSFELVAPSADEMAARITRTLERTPWLVAEVDGVVRGYAYAGRHRERPAYDWTAETTVYVDEAYVGRGLGRALMSALLGLLRRQGFHLAVAGITLPNPGSVRLHTGLGFRRVGEFEAIGWKNGGWRGVDWYTLELGPRSGAPSPIVPVGELQDGELRAGLVARPAPRQPLGG
jgi:phosphinothricin acetyltransferase